MKIKKSIPEDINEIICLEWCFSQFPNIRINTHEANIAMRKVPEKIGYQKCGIIYPEFGIRKFMPNFGGF